MSDSVVGFGFGFQVPPNLINRTTDLGERKASNYAARASSRRGACASAWASGRPSERPSAAQASRGPAAAAASRCTAAWASRCLTSSRMQANSSNGGQHMGRMQANNRSGGQHMGQGQEHSTRASGCQQVEQHARSDQREGYTFMCCSVPPINRTEQTDNFGFGF